ncbi:MAG: hypothetical protein Tsb0034_19300 [Ekhidna sp.]
MKKNLLIILGILCGSMVLANGPFEKAMSKNMPLVFSASSQEELQEVVNQLNRIGEAEGDRWEPYYYAAFGNLRISQMQEKPEDQDKFLNLALERVEKGLAISPDNSELESMKGYCYMMQLVVDPQARGMQYSGMAFSAFQKAIKLNPKNPRAHYLMGRMQLGSAQFMGGGDGGSCESFAVAKGLFEKGENPVNPFTPTWGKETTEATIKEVCEKSE